MPPSSTLPPRPDANHLLPEGKHSSGAGPMIGAVIILIVLIFGALYFYGEYLNRQDNQQPLPFIPGDPA